MALNENDFNEWRKAKERLDIAKKVELAFRIKVCEQLFGKREGEFKITDENIGIGRKVTANSRVTRSVDWESLGYDKSEFQKIGREFLADTLDLTDIEIAMMDFDMKINLSRYRKEELKAENINEMMTVTPATPMLAVKFED